MRPAGVLVRGAQVLCVPTMRHPISEVMDSSLIEMVTRHEGFRATVYCDKCAKEIYFYRGDVSAWECDPECEGGNLTIGYGTRVDGAGITEDEAKQLLAQRLEHFDWELKKESWYAALDERRRDGILDMSYTMGVAGVLQFRGMIAALGRKDWGAAAREIDLSKWAKQAPKRAAEIALIIEHG
jgi:lysozyme